MNHLKSFFLLFISLLITMHVAADENENKIKFYCAVNLKIPFEKAVKAFNELYKTEFTGDFKGTGHLMGSVRLNPIGDIFVSPDPSYILQMHKEGLIKEALPLSTSHPVLIVQKGNPKKITSLDDLAKANIKVALTNPEAASIGKLIKKLLTESKQWEAISKNVNDNGVFKPTVTEISNDVKMKVVDVAIVWDSTAKQKAYANDLEVIEIDSLKSHQETAMIGILAASKNPTLALKFARFLHAKDKGQKYFEEEGFTPIKNADKWADKPILNLFSGGMNRVGIEKALLAFQKREGVEITTVYNGCGILVGQMKAGSKPDAYFACDTSFMTQVQDNFETPENFTQASIIIVVKKDNPLKITSLDDLTKPGVRVGMGHPDQSALGFLTKKMLDEMGLYEKIKPNVSVQTPTADMIIAQFKAGALDACLVYTSSISNVKNEIGIVEIKDPRATATQPYAIANYTNNHYLLERLLEALKENHKDYTDVGFKYLLKQ